MVAKKVLFGRCKTLGCLARPNLQAGSVASTIPKGLVETVPNPYSAVYSQVYPLLLAMPNLSLTEDCNTYIINM